MHNVLSLVIYSVMSVCTKWLVADLIPRWEEVVLDAPLTVLGTLGGGGIPRQLWGRVISTTFRPVASQLMVVRRGSGYVKGVGVVDY